MRIVPTVKTCVYMYMITHTHTHFCMPRKFLARFSRNTTNGSSEAQNQGSSRVQKALLIFDALCINKIVVIRIYSFSIKKNLDNVYIFIRKNTPGLETTDSIYLDGLDREKEESLWSKSVRTYQTIPVAFLCTFARYNNPTNRMFNQNSALQDVKARLVP